MDSVFDSKKIFGSENIKLLLKKLPISRQAIIVIAYGGDYSLAEFIEGTCAEDEPALMVIDPLLDPSLDGTVNTKYGSSVFSCIDKMLEEFGDVLTDECCLVCENCATEDDIIIIDKLQPSNIFVITDLAGNTGSTAFHYWMEKCVESPPLVSLCCYKGDLEFYNSTARTSYFKALGKHHYDISEKIYSKIIGDSDFAAFVLHKKSSQTFRYEKKKQQLPTIDELWWPSYSNTNNKKNRVAYEL
jgi:hypothetical protein